MAIKDRISGRNKPRITGHDLERSWEEMHGIIPEQSAKISEELEQMNEDTRLMIALDEVLDDYPDITPQRKVKILSDLIDEIRTDEAPISESQGSLIGTGRVDEVLDTK